MDTSLVKLLFSEWQSKPIEKTFPGFLDDADKIQKEIIGLDNERKILTKRHQEKMDSINQKIVEVQERCQHQVTKKQTDPVESHTLTRCLICLKEW